MLDPLPSVQPCLQFASELDGGHLTGNGWPTPWRVNWAMAAVQSRAVHRMGKTIF
jgi:hypothetical protein